MEVQALVALALGRREELQRLCRDAAAKVAVGTSGMVGRTRGWDQLRGARSLLLKVAGWLPMPWRFRRPVLNGVCMRMLVYAFLSTVLEHQQICGSSPARVAKAVVVLFVLNINFLILLCVSFQSMGTPPCSHSALHF